jgi:hypothetical protein
MTVKWRPTHDKANALNVVDLHAFTAILREGAGHEVPCTLSDTDLPIIRAISAAYGHNHHGPNPFEELIDLIISHNSIDVWVDTDSDALTKYGLKD